MKRAPLVLFLLALVAALAWPLSSAIGAARGGAASRASLLPAACTLDGNAATPSGDGDEEEDEASALPPGHPSLAGRLPPGHPAVPFDLLPPGHPPLGGRLPSGHPPIPSGRSPVEPFGAPVLLTI